MDKEKMKKIALGIGSFLMIIVGVFIYNQWQVSQANIVEDDEIEFTEVQIAMSAESIESFFAEHNIQITLESENESKKDEVENAYQNIDFEGLWELNEDVYAWIDIPNTNISYPILQHDSNNSYYLNYNIDGSYGYPGCIYTENMNTKEFTDSNTVLYGHNLKAGTMFSELHNFRDLEFFDNTKYLFIYTTEETIAYQIFAAYIYDDRHIMKTFDFNNKTVYQTYLNSIFEKREMSMNLDEIAQVSIEDSIITLSTCVSNQDTKRMIVQAVKINIEDIDESILEYQYNLALVEEDIVVELVE